MDGILLIRLSKVLINALKKQRWPGFKNLRLTNEALNGLDVIVAFSTSH